MENDAMIKRLNELCLQDYNGYLAASSPDALAVLRKSLEQDLAEAEAELADLEKEYRILVKSEDVLHRMDVANRKSFLSKMIEAVSHAISDDEKLRIMARTEYSKTKELQDSLAEQQKIKKLIWSAR